MGFLATVASLLGVYVLLPRALRVAVEQLVEAWVDAALMAVGVDLLDRLRGSPERRAVERALAKAVASQLARYPDLEAVAIAADFRKPPFADEVTRILTDPHHEVDADRLREAFRGSRYELAQIGVDGVELLKNIRAAFLRLLQRDQRTSHLWTGVVLDRVSAAVDQMLPGVARIDEGVDRLVQAHLQHRAVSPFLTREEYYRPLLDSRRLFHHGWLLVGRAAYLRQLEEFAKGEGHILAILPGRGGIGKSRLLLAVAERLEASLPRIAVRFVADARPVAARHFAGLPEGPALIILDDAHRREDLATFLSEARRRAPAVKVLLATRPYGLAGIHSTAVQAGYDVRETAFLEQLPELDRDAMIQLATQALGPDYAHLAERLAEATFDSPLVTAIGGKLIAEQSVPPGLLAQNDAFRDAVLTRLAHEYVRALEGQVDRGLAQRILELVAATAPIRPQDEDFLRHAEAFLSIQRDELLRALDLMEAGGILLRRGATLRITPDVLADFMLQRACVTASGHKTGYADRIFEAFFDVVPSEVLRNLAELDWQVRRALARETDLLAGIWARLEEDFRRRSHFDRMRMLELLRDVAIFQPDRTLALVQFAVQNPSAVADPAAAALDAGWSHQHVLEAVPELLRRIAYHPEYSAPALDLLWELGRDDRSGQGVNPSPAVRILAEFAGYETRSDLTVAVLDAVDRWMRDPGVHAHAHSILDVIDPIFEKSGTRTEYEESAVRFQPFWVIPEHAQPIRDRALGVVVRCTESDSLAVVLRAVRSLRHALGDARGDFGTAATTDLRSRWVPEQLRVLEILEGVAEAAPDHLVLIEVMHAVRWQALHGSQPEVRERARSILSSIPEDFGLLLTRHFIAQHERLDVLEARSALEEDELDQGTEGRWAQLAARDDRDREKLVEEFLARYPDPAAGLRGIEERLGAVASAGEIAHPDQFLVRLAEKVPAYGEALCVTAAATKSLLNSHLAGVLNGIRLSNLEAANPLLLKLLGYGDPAVDAAVASACAGAFATGTADAVVVRMLERLLSHSDEQVRARAFEALRILSEAEPDRALSLALVVDLGRSEELAEDFFRALAGRSSGGYFKHIDSAAATKIVAKLVQLDQIRGYWASEFLKHACRVAPRAVVELILERARVAVASSGFQYRLMPEDLDDQFTALGSIEDRLDLLREIRDLLLREHVEVDFWLPRLFAAVSRSYDELGRAVLQEWISSGDANKLVKAAALLEYAPWEFLLDQEQFVVDMLNNANGGSSSCLAEVKSALMLIAARRERNGGTGEALPDDDPSRKRARDIAGRLTPGSPGHAFYQSLAAPL